MCALQAHLCLIEAQGSLELRARAHYLIADTYLRSVTSQHLPAVRAEVEHSLTRAVACCDAAEWWVRGDAAATLLALVRRACADNEGAELAAAKALAFGEAAQRADRDVVV